MKNYAFIFSQFEVEFGDRLVDSIIPDEILSFLTKLTDGTRQSTKRNRYSSLKAFFNYIKNSINPNFQNPCDTPISTTQRYLGKISDTEALKWIENLYG